VLGKHFRQLEIEQLRETNFNGLDPDEQFYHDIISEDSILNKDKYTKRSYDGSITIKISRAKDDYSWVFKVTDLDNKPWNIWTTGKNPNCKPGSYDPFELFQAIIRKFAFPE
jgi:hypothetical protein